MTVAWTAKGSAGDTDTETYCVCSDVLSASFQSHPSILTATCSKFHHQRCQKLGMTAFQLLQFRKSLRSRWNRRGAPRKQLCNILPTASNPKKHQGSLPVVAQVKENILQNSSSGRECNTCAGGLSSVHSGLSSPVSCKLRALFLYQDPEYCAVSYVWGNLDTTEAILVNGEVLPVPKKKKHGTYSLRCEAIDV